MLKKYPSNSGGLFRRACLASVLAIVPLFAGQAVADTSLPHGATALRETYGDWTVDCQQLDGGEGQGEQQGLACLMSQTIVNAQRQRVMSVSFAARTEDGAVTGEAVLPFGVAVAESLRLAVDGQALDPPRRFATCLPVGCLVPLSLDAQQARQLTDGKLLLVTVPTWGGEPLELSVSLKGFAAAMDRLDALPGTAR